MLGYGKGKDCGLTKILGWRFSDRGARACLAIGFRRLIPFLILRSLSLSAPMPLTVTERPVFALRTTVVVTGEALSTCFPDDALRGLRHDFQAMTRCEVAFEPFVEGSISAITASM